VAVAAPATPYGPAFDLMMAAQDHRLGMGLGATWRLEGSRFGVGLSALGFFAQGPGQEAPFQENGLAAVRFGWAFFSGERGRLRLEAGASAILQRSQGAIGPDLGVSGLLKIWGPFGLSGSAYVRPFPVKQIELRAAAFVALGLVRIEGGLHRIRVESEPGSDELDWANGYSDPYLGLAIAF